MITGIRRAYTTDDWISFSVDNSLQEYSSMSFGSPSLMLGSQKVRRGLRCQYRGQLWICPSSALLKVCRLLVQSHSEISSRCFNWHSAASRVGNCRMAFGEYLWSPVEKKPFYSHDDLTTCSFSLVSGMISTCSDSHSAASGGREG